jgi:hypothetical protein
MLPMMSQEKEYRKQCDEKILCEHGLLNNYFICSKYKTAENYTFNITIPK